MSVSDARTVTETGQFADLYPYLRIGTGPKTLLVIPGLGDAMFDGEYGRQETWFFKRLFDAFRDEYTVYVVSRPRGLGDDYFIEAMAQDYARVLESDIGSASVFGLSMGGLIAQEVARERPDLVERLVVGVSGCRLAANGRPLVRQLRSFALEEDWLALRSRLYEHMFTGARGRLYPLLSRTVGRLQPPTPAAPGDVVTSVDAVLEYDGSDRLGEIEPRTLVIGAAEDPFFTEAILRETHAGLPDSQLAMYQNGKHGVFLEQRAGFTGWIRRFLEGETARVPQRS
ncbi:alpha/beta fold hydrolase [Halopiger aswanensis]|uniref:Pimeloyl-ACP methyl ester carboxylesterase n=1 Tax=Halopiger aswanensis TaxID=148449 RepID=A0A3R7HXM2_9EURY|nr:alpha/beta hydrolase [Halopiger aswanensis]RKD95098.1 pimeloyl-ACP methyl ester carboxylesterase [Halopiger aswanensis]